MRLAARTRDIVTSPVGQFLVAAALAIIPTLPQLYLATSLIGAPMMTYLPAVALARHLAGRWSGVFVAIVGSLVCASLIFTPPWTFTLGQTFQGYFLLGLFVAGAAIILLLYEDRDEDAPPERRALAAAGAGGAWGQQDRQQLAARTIALAALNSWITKNIAVTARPLRLYRRGAAPAHVLAPTGVEERHMAVRSIHSAIGRLPYDEARPADLLERVSQLTLDDASGGRIRLDMITSYAFRPAHEHMVHALIMVAEILWDLALSVPDGGAVRMTVQNHGDDIVIHIEIIEGMLVRDARTHYISATATTIVHKMARDMGARYERISETERILQLPMAR